MPTSTKATKKATKKSAPKSAMKMLHLHPENGPDKKAPHEIDAPGKKDRKDVRRAYEHLGRVEVLQASLGADSALEAVNGLGNMARAELESGHAEGGADLLRAAEHFSFATLAPKIGRTGDVSAKLETTLRQHFEKLMKRAAEQWSEDADTRLEQIYALARQGAAEAMEIGSFHQALEYARAAEAIADIKLHGKAASKGTPKKRKGATAAKPKPHSSK